MENNWRGEEVTDEDLSSIGAINTNGEMVIATDEIKIGLNKPKEWISNSPNQEPNQNWMKSHHKTRKMCISSQQLPKNDQIQSSLRTKTDPGITRTTQWRVQQAEQEAEGFGVLIQQQPEPKFDKIMKDASITTQTQMGSTDFMNSDQINT